MSEDDESSSLLMLQRDLDRKTELIKSLQAYISEIEESLDTLQAENQQLKTLLLEAQQSISKGEKSAVSQLFSNGGEGEETIPKAQDLDGYDNEEDLDLPGRISVFLKTVEKDPMGEISRDALNLHAINHAMCMYHLDYSSELTNTDDANQDNSAIIPVYPKYAELKSNEEYWTAVRIAFDAACIFLQQMSVMQRRKETVTFEADFPLQWLLGSFPASAQLPIDATSWLPLHVFLASDPVSNLSTNDIDIAASEYLDHVDLLLKVFGDSAFREEVSPLTIAVAKRKPYLPAIELVAQRRPESLLREDEDGSLPLFHAAGCNDGADCVVALIDLAPSALTKADNFGCGAVHYAAFSGTATTMQVLLDRDASAARRVEGNGALPLHDAVMNGRGFEEQALLVDLLLEAYPDAVKKRDANGAFPLHNAARCSDYLVSKRILDAWPDAAFAADNEELLPLHHYSERSDRIVHQEIQLALLAVNPTAEVKSDAVLFAAPKSGQSATVGSSGGALGWLFNRSAKAAADTQAQQLATAGGKGGRRRSSVKHVAHGVLKRSSVVRSGPVGSAMARR